MVIISTSPTDVSIQAVSPALGEQSVRILAPQAGGAAAAASAKAAWKVGRHSKIARTSAPARANSPAHEKRLNVMISLLSVLIEVRGSVLWWSMVFPENRCPLFGIMLWIF